jgi:hypothetical protein
MKVGTARKVWIRVFTAAAILGPTLAPAELPQPLQRLGRVHGVGWGDGYHVCERSGIRLMADLPPHSHAGHTTARRPIATFYDHFDAGRSGCDQTGCSCDSVTVIRGSEVMQVPLQPADSQPKSDNKESLPAAPKTALPQQRDLPKPTIVPTPAPELPSPADSSSQRQSLKLTTPVAVAPQATPRAQRPEPTTPIKLSQTPRDIVPIHPGFGTEVVGSTAGNHNPLQPDQRSNTATPKLVMPSPEQAIQQLTTAAAGAAKPAATPAIAQQTTPQAAAKPVVASINHAPKRPHRLGSNEKTPVLSIQDSPGSMVQANPFMDRPVLELARRRESTAGEVIYQPTTSLLK